VLDLGGGTGALSCAVLDGLPGVRVTVLDVDRDMLGEARQRLTRFGDRVSFLEGSFLDPLAAADAVVASLALHHVHDLQSKTGLYRAIRDALSPGGVLLSLDAAVTEGARLNQLVFRPDGGADGRSWHHRLRGAPPLCRVGGRGPLPPG
jgi:tRNA (cmo5U34)-methyltransferase